MTALEQTPEAFYHTITLNNQKGDTYAIKFKNDPVVYVGVPVMDMTGSNDQFSFSIMEPSDKKGVVSRSIGSIELMNPQ